MAGQTHSMSSDSTPRSSTSTEDGSYRPVFNAEKHCFVTMMPSAVASPNRLLEVLKDALGVDTFAVEMRNDIFRISYPQQLDREELARRCRANRLDRKTLPPPPPPALGTPAARI